MKCIGFFGHGGSGKTQISDAILYLTGVNTRLGRVDEGTSLFDFDPFEIERKTGLFLATGFCDYRDERIFIVDTPGYADFFGEALSGIRAVDTAVIVIDATSGIEVGTELTLREAEKAGLPRVLFINKAKKEDVSIPEVVKAAQASFGTTAFVVTLPVEGGLVDLLSMRYYRYEGERPKVVEIPDSIRKEIEKEREKLVEGIVETSDELMERYLEGGEIKDDELKRVFREGLRKGSIFPILVGDALNLFGIQELLDFIVEFVPSPSELPDIDGHKRSPDGPFIGFVFKTISEPHLGDMNLIRVLSGSISPGELVMNSTAKQEEKINQIFLIQGRDRQETNRLEFGSIGALVKLKSTKTSDTLTTTSPPIVLPRIEFPHPTISVAIIPKSKGDEEKISNGLARIQTEDPTFESHYDPDLKQLIISGLGELHLDLIIARLKSRFGVSVDTARPRIPYRETFVKTAEAQGKYKKQTGGRGQYGDVWLRIEPLERGKGFEFENKIVGGVVPAKYIPSVEKGVKEALAQGILAGYPVIDVKVTIYDGSHHPVDSSDIAFKIAGSMAVKNCAQKAGVKLLEPIYEVEVLVPDEYLGDIVGDLNARRGKIMGMDTEGRFKKVKALVPLAEMHKYSTALRSITQGRGQFQMKFYRYEDVPKELVNKLIEENR
ncbi:elongation factor G [candidate division WOR-3 bacterium]|uniref:Elongation factor G n=1 Tax=candidate division WOR-3 bacterium TaxID=2052148 RepID=A0A660SJ86_UNCW3|nr:MAG: elongation factor G [candidate division WOR-3 bacterium]